MLDLDLSDVSAKSSWPRYVRHGIPDIYICVPCTLHPYREVWEPRLVERSFLGDTLSIGLGT